MSLEKKIEKLKRGLEDYNRIVNKVKEYNRLVSETLKNSQVEILLSEIKIDNTGVSVYPTNCPGKGRKQDVLYDKDGNASCMYNSKTCPYFVGAAFYLDDYTKNIDCKVM